VFSNQAFSIVSSFCNSCALIKPRCKAIAIALEREFKVCSSSKLMLSTPSFKYNDFKRFCTPRRERKRLCAIRLSVKPSAMSINTSNSASVINPGFC